LDLTKVALTSDGDKVTVTWTVAGTPVPAKGTALYSVMVSSQDGNISNQFGVKYLDGKQVAYFVFDFAGTKQVNISGTAKVGAHSVEGAFDASALPKTITWRANSNRNGDDVDACPEPGDKAVDPDTLVLVR
jgi:hypothetical protein